MPGVRVARGRFPGCTTLYGLSSRVEHEALHPLTHARCRCGRRSAAGNPGAAGRDRHDPAFGVGGLDRGRAGGRTPPRRSRRHPGQGESDRRALGCSTCWKPCTALGVRCRRDRRASCSSRSRNGFSPSWKCVGVSRARVLVVAAPSRSIRSGLLRVVLREQTFDAAPPAGSRDRRSRSRGPR